MSHISVTLSSLQCDFSFLIFTTLNPKCEEGEDMEVETKEEEEEEEEYLQWPCGPQIQRGSMCPR